MKSLQNFKLSFVLQKTRGVGERVRVSGSGCLGACVRVHASVFVSIGACMRQHSLKTRGSQRGAIVGETEREKDRQINEHSTNLGLSDEWPSRRQTWLFLGP